MAGLGPCHRSVYTSRLVQQHDNGVCVPFCSGRFVRSKRLSHVRITKLPRGQPADAAAGDAAAGDAFDASQREPERDYQPFPRMAERDPYRLLGLSKDASFEEIQDARNYLYDQYRWHEPSRESIELAFDSLIQEKLNLRHKLGFRPPRTGRRGEAVGEAKVSLWRRFQDLFDPTVTFNTLINEGAVFGALALWALFSSDQSFPLAGGFAYSVYKFQSKRTKRNPDGPYFGGNPIVGAIISTVAALAVACGLMAAITTPLSALVNMNMRQVGGFMVVLVVGVINVYLK